MAKVESYLDFIRYCLNEQQRIPIIADWDALYQFMKKQSLLGVGFAGVERIKAAGGDVPRPVLLKWYSMRERIKARNMEMNKMCVKLVELLKRDGLESCILKGQGNTLLYPDPYSRMSGDIDIFVMPKEPLSIHGRRKAIMTYVRKYFPNTRIRYQHIDFPVFKGVEVEMHFIPTAKNNPVHNYRIQQWVESQLDAQCRNMVDLPDGVGQITIPTSEFNVIYQLSHLMHHFFDEGVGFRQVMDYYYLLQHYATAIDKTEVERLLNHFGMRTFAGAVMWVLHEVFELDEQFFLVPADRQRGQLLLEEILKGGNFGRDFGLNNHSTGVKYFLKIKRNLRFVRAYPAEALSEPIFRTWHFFWRLSQRFSA